MVEQVIQWRDSKGKLHDTEHAARAADAAPEFRARLAKMATGLAPQQLDGPLLSVMLKRPIEFADALIEFAESTGAKRGDPPAPVVVPPPLNPPIKQVPAKAK